MQPDTSSRSGARLLAIASGLDVQRNAAFMSSEGRTLCNDYANAFTVALGCPIPPTLANDQHDWLAGQGGHDAGWRQLVDAPGQPPVVEQARLLAEAGAPVIASWKNSSGGHGHIAVCVPAPDSDQGTLYVSAAGAQNWQQAPLTRSFGLSIHPDFFTHD